MKLPIQKLQALALILSSALLAAACSGVHTAAGGSGSGGTTGPYAIGGSVSGLNGTGLVLEDNGGDNLTITKNGSFTFPTLIASGKPYAVTVGTQPTNPAQSCAVTNGSGTASAAVTNVTVTCANTVTNATVGVTVSGLAGTGLVLQDNGGDSLTIPASGSYTFKTPVTGAYAVTVLTQPVTPNQICTVSGGSGTATTPTVTATVACVNSFVIGGTVTGVVGTGLVLKDNGADPITITQNGAFMFDQQLPTGSPYAVTIDTQPSSPAQTCVVTQGTGSGTATMDITSVAIVCPAITYSIGGNVVGLLGKTPPPPNQPLTDNSFQLLNNGGDNRIITQNGPFTFATPVARNGQYDLSVISFPSTQTEGCTLWDYKGVATANVTDILVDCAHNDWIWTNGQNVAGVDGTPQYGSFPATPPPTDPNPWTNTPGARDSGATWTVNGVMVLFGGLGFELSGNTQPDTRSGFLNDMWVCDVSSSAFCEWQLIEAPVSGLFPIAQHEDISGSTNLPGGRWGAGTWTDNSGNLWLFGGQGVDTSGNIGLLGDLWEFTGGFNGGTWTQVAGSSLVNQAGVYTGGTLAPGARWAPVTWKDTAGNFWMFGGFGYDKTGTVGFLNDLWEYTGGHWVWASSGIANSNVINQNGVYGTQGTGAAANTPGSRQTAVGWADPNGNLWLFGGEGLDSTGTPNGILNDLWEYSIANNQWVWVAGSSTANQTGSYGLAPVIGPANTATAAGTVGLTQTPGSFPGSRWGATSWIDHDGNLWLFGGWGQDSTGTNGNGYLNDLWAYVPSTTFGQAGTWSWVKGSNTGGQNGIYGENLDRPYLTKVTWTPGGRRGAMSWIDNANRFWLLGGQGYDASSATGQGYLNDQWRYLPYP
jgi:galactose oxidase-like protein